MPGNSKTTTQTSTTTPWTEAQPFLKDAMGEAQGLYNQGGGFTAYPGSTVVPFSSQTQSALSGIQGLAQGGDPLAQASNQNAQGVINSGGLSPYQLGGLQNSYGIATGQNNIGTEADFRNLLSSGAGPSAISDYLTPYARGDYINGGSPQFNQALDTQSGKLADDINRSWSNAGRYGSASQANDLGQQIGDFRNNALQSEISRQQGLQQSAAQALSGEQQQGFGNQAGLLSNITGIQGQNLANTLGAGGLINQAGNQGQSLAAQYSSLAPSIYQSLFAPQERMASVGSQYEDLSTRQLQDAISKYTTNQQAPYNELSYYNALLNGAGQLGSSTTGSVTQPSSYNFGSPLGGALAGGSLFGPFGALGGGLLGLLGGFG